MASINIPVSPTAINTFRDMQKQSMRFIVFKMCDKKIDIAATGGSDATFDDFASHLPVDECRYGVIKMTYNAPVKVQGVNEGIRSKTVFVLWTPDGSNVRERFTYTSAQKCVKRSFNESMIGMQANDKSLTEEDLLKKCLAFTS